MLTPKELFRWCLQPSPAWPVRARLRGLELPLYFRPPCFHELGSDALAGRLLLLGPGRPLFASGDAARVALDASDLLRLAPELRAFLAWVPHYGQPHGEALLDGAQDVANLPAAYQLGACVEATGPVMVERPDRWFGLPLGALQDCHWLAYRTAREVFDQALRATQPSAKHQPTPPKRKR